MNRKTPLTLRHLLPLLLLATCLSVCSGCHRRKAMVWTSTADSASIVADSAIPAMRTTDVDMLISDSGVIRYHVVSPLWLRYTLSNKVPYQYFPEGLQLDHLDSLMQPSAHIEADTAWNYERTRIWRLRSNVYITSRQGEQFRTQELYWDMSRRIVYSDSFIHIERPDAILEGYGFKSDDTFTQYEIRQTTGIFDVEESRLDAQPDDEDTETDN